MASQPTPRNVQLAFTISPEEAEQIVALAKADDRSVASLLRTMVREGLERRQGSTSSDDVES